MTTVLGQKSWLDESVSVPDGADFVVRSRTRRGLVYPMVRMPEGYAVHQGEGCEGEMFNGVLGCWHVKEYSMTSLVTTQESLIPQRIEFSDTQIDTIANVICVDSDGHAAPKAFTELFLATCRHSGLNPFLKQIYALKVRGKWTMYVGIDGYRVISERTGLDQGMDGPQWSDDGVEWFDYPMVDRPKFARVGIWRKGVPRAYIAVCKLSAYEQPSSPRWKDDAPGQLAKCAESLARRRAFPADTAVIPPSASLEEPAEMPDFPDAIEGEFRNVADEPAPEPEGTGLRRGPANGDASGRTRGVPQQRTEDRVAPVAQNVPAAAPPNEDTQEAGATVRSATSTAMGTSKVDGATPPASSPTVWARVRTELENAYGTWDKPSWDALYKMLCADYPYALKGKHFTASALSEPDAEAVLSRFQPSCEHVWQFNEAGTQMVCELCGTVQEEQASLLKTN